LCEGIVTASFEASIKSRILKKDAMLKTILDTLRKARVKKKLSQENLADYLGMTQSSYAKIEKGQTHLTLNNLFKICKCLEIDPSDLFSTKKQTVVSGGGVSIDKIFEEHIKDLSEIRNLLQDINSRPINYHL
jgi:transcriptional regulator with XRE-family HTH domain